MISVCIATYNGEKYIENLLRSILCQLNSDDEIIVTDDCSTDKTVDVINNINDRRIIVLLNESNKGVNKTFERSINYARGEIILLADQDDVWHSEKIKIIIDRFNRYKDIYVIHHDAVVKDNNGNEIASSFYAWRNNVGPGWFRNFIRDTHLGCCMAFRKELKEIIMPIPNIGYHDRWIGISASLAGYQEEYIEDKLIDYIRHRDTTTSQYLKRRDLWTILRDRFKLMIAMMSFIRRIRREKMGGTE